MQCYRFYKIPKDDSHSKEYYEKYRLDQYPIYALTNDKKLAEKFIKQRNMDRFICCKSKMDKEEYSILANRYRSTVLKEEELFTVVDKYTKEAEKMDIKVVMTYDEYISVCDDPVIPCFMNDVAFWALPGTVAAHISIFKKKFQKALDYVFWRDNYKLMAQYGIINLDDDYSAPDYYVDELELFVDTYGELL